MTLPPFPGTTTQKEQGGRPVLALLKVPAAVSATALTETLLQIGDRCPWLLDLTPRDAAHCKPFYNRPLFRLYQGTIRPDAAVHSFRGTKMLFIAAGPDHAMEAIQVNKIRMMDGTVIKGCTKVVEALGLKAGDLFSAEHRGRQLILTQLNPPPC